MNNILTSTLQTSILIATSIIAITAFLSSVYLIGIKIALPFGLLLSTKFLKIYNRQPLQEHIQHLGKILAGILLLLICFICLIYEQTSLLGGAMRPLGFWEFAGLAGKGCVEALIVLGILRMGFAVVQKLVL